jgi:hypothetical protein
MVSCEHGNEPSGSIKCSKIFIKLRNISLDKKGSASCKWFVVVSGYFIQAIQLSMINN